jgi:hypothetical protein
MRKMPIFAVAELLSHQKVTSCPRLAGARAGAEIGNGLD